LSLTPDRLSRDRNWDEGRDEDASVTLDQIAAGVTSRCLLGWISLMRSGSEPGTIERWRMVAGNESKNTFRATYNALVTLFEEFVMERTATVRGSDLPPALRAWVRDLFHTEPTDAAELSVILRQPGNALTPDPRIAARQRLLGLMGRFAERTKDVPQAALDEAVEEAMRFVRGQATDARHD
jgi:hypothetical protein